jgi:hypothetical protein
MRQSVACIPCTTTARSYLNEYLPILDDGSIGLDGDHTWRRHNLAGFDIELTIVKIAFDDILLDVAFGERTRAMGAGIVGHEELAGNIEDGKDQIVVLDFEGSADLYVRGVAEFDLR